VSPTSLFQFKNLEVNPTGDRQGNVANGYSAQRGTFQRPEVGMTVNDEIGYTPVQYGSQLAVSEHPVLGKRLAAERGSSRSEVEHRDAQVGVQRKKGAFERLALPASPNGKPL
jgi:hypothetical protein